MVLGTHSGHGRSIWLSESAIRLYLAGEGVSETPLTDAEFERIRREYRGAGDGALASAKWYADSLEKQIKLMRDAIEMHLHNVAIVNGKTGKAWDGNYVLRAMRDALDYPRLTIIVCGQSKCEHAYSGWRDFEQGGGTAVCAKCGAEAFSEAAWE